MKQYTFAWIIAGTIGLLGIGIFFTKMDDFFNRPLSIPQQGAYDVTTLPKSHPPELLSVESGSVLDLEMGPVQHKIGEQVVSMLGYNGSIPGPTVHVKQGSEITVRLHNNTTLPTTLHAHGVRMANAFDGVPDLTQKAIEPGETFTYQLTFPDAGAFWYHPHVRTDYTVESGLYGAIIVEPKDPDYWPAADRNQVLMLDDIALNEQGLLPFDQRVATHTLMGRFGTTLLVNGEKNYQVQAQVGETLRLYLTNAANTRLFHFSLAGQKLKVLGADGGKYAREIFVDSLIIAPGERRVVDVTFNQAGTFALQHRAPDVNVTMGSFLVGVPQTTSTTQKTDFEMLRFDEPLENEMQDIMRQYLLRNPDKELVFSLKMGHGMQHGMPERMHVMDDGAIMKDADMGMGGDGDAYEWEDTMGHMNAQSTSRTLEWQLVDQATGKTNMNIDDWRFTVGEKIKIRLFNDPRSMHPMQHPIHFHGQRFMVIATNGVPNEQPVWLDTALIAKGDTVDIVLDITNPGTWMAHCHILEHAESGMMFPFTVVE